MKKVTLILVVMVIWCVKLPATTVTASSPSLRAVQAAISSAADGDTLIVPAGTATWASTLIITKGITIVGQTTVDSVAGTAKDLTIILVGTGTNRNQPLLRLNTASSKAYRISGLTFRTGQTTTMNANGMIRLFGNSHAVRIDHCHFDDLVYEGRMIGVQAAVYGVIDHNLFEYRTTGNNFSVSVDMPDWAGQTQGHGSWAEPAYYGSEKFIFIEDNYINNTTGRNAGAIDAVHGGKYVYRYNHVWNSWATNHGTEIGPYRGCRAFEVYNNDFHWTWSGQNVFASSRSGGLIAHDNINSGAQLNHGITIGSYRVEQTFGPPFAGATGDNPWDYNVTEQDGTHIDGHAPYLFESGTVASGSTTTLVDTSKNWGVNQWVGYTAKRVSDNAFMIILSNTSNTLTGYYNPGYKNPLNWTAGDQYQIHKVLIALDEPCRGAGDLVVGGTSAVNSTTGKPSWIHQALEPCYSWNNGSYTIQLAQNGTSAVLREGRDYFNNTPMPGYKPYTYPHPLVSGGPNAPQRSKRASNSQQRSDLRTGWPW